MVRSRLTGWRYMLVTAEGMALVVMVPALCRAQGRASDRDFVNRARFSVDRQVGSASTGVATMEPRAGVPGYSGLRIYLYRAAELADSAKGKPPKNWQAVLQLSVDRQFMVGQVDMAIPGHTFTIASEGDEVKNFLQVYRLDGKHLRLKSKGTHVCDFSVLRVPNQTFRWDVDLALPIVPKAVARKN